MRTRAISPGDLVLVNKRGRVFYARVLGTGAAGGLSVEPLDRADLVAPGDARARSSITGRTRGPIAPSARRRGQLALDGLTGP